MATNLLTSEEVICIGHMIQVHPIQMNLMPPVETIFIKCQILFSGRNKKTIINLSSAELAERVVKVKGPPPYYFLACQKANEVFEQYQVIKGIAVTEQSAMFTRETILVTF